MAAAGIVPGLVLGDQPFGFISLLGVFALVVLPAAYRLVFDRQEPRGRISLA